MRTRVIPTFEMIKREIVYKSENHQAEDDLQRDVKTDANAIDMVGLFSHGNASRLGLPFPSLEHVVGQG